MFLTLSIMFAFIAVIVKRETRLLLPLTRIKSPPHGLGLTDFKFFLAFCISLI